MKHKSKLTAALLALLLAALCGCGDAGQDAAPLHLAVVAGIHSNAGGVPLQAEAVTTCLSQTAMTQGEITMIRADGAPAVVYQASIPQLPISGLSESKQKAIAREYMAQLQTALDGIRAETPELDTLEAIRLGAAALAGRKGQQVLLVLDTGLSTTGYLDFTQGLLDAEPEAVVEALRQAQALPRLDGVAVLWALCGQTAPPQPPLSERDKQSLQNIWEQVLLAGGASEVRFLNDFAVQAPADLPPVSVVETGDRSLRVEIPMTVLSDAQVRFQGDSDRLVDPEGAVRALEPVAVQLLAQPDRQAYLVGTTASGRDEAWCLELSLKRAEAVKRLLVDRLGMPEGQLTCLGLGTRDPWHVDDRDENGQVEALAALNRKVVLLDADSAEAEAAREVVSNFAK